MRKLNKQTVAECEAIQAKMDAEAYEATMKKVRAEVAKSKEK